MLRWILIGIKQEEKVDQPQTHKLETYSELGQSENKINKKYFQSTWVVYVKEVSTGAI